MSCHRVRRTGRRLAGKYRDILWVPVSQRHEVGTGLLIRFQLPLIGLQLQRPRRRPRGVHGRLTAIPVPATSTCIKMTARGQPLVGCLGSRLLHCDGAVRGTDDLGNHRETRAAERRKTNYLHRRRRSASIGSSATHHSTHLGPFGGEGAQLCQSAHFGAQRLVWTTVQSVAVYRRKATGCLAPELPPHDDSCLAARFLIGSAGPPVLGARRRR